MNNACGRVKHLRRSAQDVSSHPVERTLFEIVAAFFAAFYLEMYLEAIMLFHTGSYSGILDGTNLRFACLRLGVLFLLLFGVLHAVVACHRVVLHALYRFRYPIVIALLVAGVALSLSGASIWCYALTLPSSDQGLIFGIPRSIRSDDWLVDSSLFSSQSASGFSEISSIIEGVNNNVSIGFNLPSWSIVALLRPFQWGYLILGFARGLSFCWCVRPLALFLITFECMMLFTRKNKWLSATAAIAIGFSPFVEWWGGSFYFMVYGQALVLCLHYFLRQESHWKKRGLGLLLAWLCGCYVMTMYPAWMVPFFYLFAGMGIIDVMWFVRDAKHDEGARALLINKIDVLCLLGSLVLVAGIIGAGFHFVPSEIARMAGTVYPGERFSLGGDALRYIGSAPWSLFFAVNPSSPTVNYSECSAIVALFPAGAVASTAYCIRKKKIDPAVMILLILEVATFVFMVFGFPSWLSAITLMSNVISTRAIGELGYLDLFLLVYVLARCSDVDVHGVATSKRKVFLVGASALLSMGFVAVARMVAGIEFRTLYMVLLFLLFAGMIYCVLSRFVLCDRRYEKWLLVFFVVGAFLPGVCVNPIQQGVGPLTNSDLSNAVKAVLQEPEASDDQNDRWIALDSLVTPNVCVAAGAKTINCTNVIPNLELWETVDESGEYSDIYNRYAHVNVVLGKGKTTFSLVQEDVINVTLSYEDLEKLRVGYIVSSKKLTSESPDGGISFVSVGKGDGFTIYRVEYNDAT